MREIREVLRLYFAAALSIRAIAPRSLGTSPSTVGEYLRRAKVAGLSWPLHPASESALYATRTQRRRPAPAAVDADAPHGRKERAHKELAMRSSALCGVG